MNGVMITIGRETIAALLCLQETIRLSIAEIIDCAHTITVAR